jgi:hypothetical protein
MTISAIHRVLVAGIAPPEAGMGAKPVHLDRLDIAPAFFSPTGGARIAGALDGLKHIRLTMIGAESPSEARPPKRPLDEPEPRFQRRLLREGLDARNNGMRGERDRFLFTRAVRASLKAPR